MTDREKLIELLGGDMCKGCFCDECEHENDEKSCIEHIKRNMADHLLANGVTFATDTNVGNKWISVDEELPEGDVPVIAWEKDWQEVCFVNFETREGGCLNGDSFTAKSFDGLTHWMPLPDPPKEG